MKVAIKKYNIKKIIWVLPLFFLMWTIYGCNTGNADYLNYLDRFNNGTFAFGENGFKAIMDLYKNITGGRTYQGFLMVLSFVIMSYLLLVVLKYSKTPGTILLLFFFYPFFMFCITVRYAICFCIVTTAIFIYMGKSKKSVWIFLLLIMVATTIHASSLFFLILLLQRLKIKKIQKMCFFVGIIILAVVLTYTPVLYNLAYVYSGGSAKITEWFTNHARFGMVIPISQQLFSYYAFYKAYKFEVIHGIETKLNGVFLSEINDIMLFLIPCYFITGTFTRLYWAILFINTLYISEIIYFERKYKLGLSKLSLLQCGQVLFFSLVEVINKPNVWMPFIANNLIWGN